MKSDTISISELSIGAVAAGKAMLLGAIEQNDLVSIDVDPVARVDVAGVQLIVSARHYAELKGKTVRLSKPAQGPLLEILEKAGFLAGSSAERAFWLNQEIVQ